MHASERASNKRARNMFFDLNSTKTIYVVSSAGSFSPGSLYSRCFQHLSQSIVRRFASVSKSKSNNKYRFTLIGNGFGVSRAQHNYNNA